MICDDWGLQDRLYLQPESWREIWKDAYARLIDCLHSHGMKFFLHSCGMIRSIIDDLVEIGVDVFQFDQPTIYDYDDLSRVLYGKATLYSEADIQRVLPTGNKEFIQAEAKRMMDAFFNGGGFIARDYANYQDINIKDEWASYAREVFTGAGKEKAVCL
jgi:uroporphyrinogen-III decarboxylase